MSGGIALVISGIVIFWLFLRDNKIRPMASPGLWIPLAWIAIIGTRPISSWFGFGDDLDSADAFLEGSPLDRNTLIALIVIGVIVIIRRSPEWGPIFRRNIWFTAFFVYCAISIIWSDYPFVSFKRWIRELGNVIMIMIIISEENPGNATRAVLARYAYLVIPFSIVLIRYLPSIGTYYSTDASGIAYSGVTTHKNSLGNIMLICGTFLSWEFLYMRQEKERKTAIMDSVVAIVLLSMVAWLMFVSESSTALLCLLIAFAVLIVMKFSCVKRQARYLGVYLLFSGFLVIGLYSAQGIFESVTGIVGRDLTLTGRTELWADVLSEPINPVLGTGFQSFWLGSRADYLWERYLFHPRQAHNGYLETYLNGGLLGLYLLMALVMSIGSKLIKELEGNNSFGILLFVFWVAALFYNCTEARFVGPNLLWILLSLAALYRPPAET